MLVLKYHQSIFKSNQNWNMEVYQISQANLFVSILKIKFDPFYSANYQWTFKSYKHSEKKKIKVREHFGGSILFLIQ